MPAAIRSIRMKNTAARQGDYRKFTRYDRHPQSTHHRLRMSLGYKASTGEVLARAVGVADLRTTPKLTHRRILAEIERQLRTYESTACTF